MGDMAAGSMCLFSGAADVSHSKAIGELGIEVLVSHNNSESIDTIFDMNHRFLFDLQCSQC